MKIIFRIALVLVWLVVGAVSLSGAALAMSHDQSLKFDQSIKVDPAQLDRLVQSGQEAWVAEFLTSRYRHLVPGYDNADRFINALHRGATCHFDMGVARPIVVRFS